MPKDKTTDLLNAEPFEEKEFLTYEKDRAKAVITVFIMAFLLAIASTYLYLQGLWYMAVLLFFILVLFLKYVLSYLKIPFPKRGWHKFLLFAQLFFTWLIFWIVFLNPPFAVVSGPQIGPPQYEPSANVWQTLSGTGGVYDIPYNASHSIRVSVSFVSGITSYTVSQLYKGTLTDLTSNLFSGSIYFNTTASPFAGYPVYLTITASSGTHSSTDNIELDLA